ncbi:hypothetical protein [Silvimonas iriomotensis]|uniref:Uncharacterized protein n=1 Tax=Silvimonas iriomotensis TaxID=449662 RepID=A0ABQ2PES5_9NEIS|nr:hypothetical protein [Silvimonas iriomotensis]GGP24058.1 hypothetical protein GCM10010970_40580 [Silvimonas iriomotensis]
MNWRGLASGAFAVLATGFYFGWSQGWLPWGQTASANAPAPIPCADLAQGCSFSLAGHDYHLQSDGPVTPSRPFVLKLAGAPLTSATASWKMAGMEMSPNLFHFTPDAQGQWQTRSALPFCTQSRNDWLLTINVNKNKAVLAVQPR